MSKKLEKYREEYQKNCEIIENLQARNNILKPLIREEENKRIIGIVRECRLTPEQLAAFLNAGNEQKEEILQEYEKSEVTETE
ncbi:MAG: DUF4315 family protein [Clostridia bacterium]|nr:DUF4315 family protein [Clostridia bacterium]